MARSLAINQIFYEREKHPAGADDYSMAMMRTLAETASSLRRGIKL
jgi:hypothetical protein